LQRFSTGYVDTHSASIAQNPRAAYDGRHISVRK